MEEWKEWRVVEDGCSIEYDEEAEAYCMMSEHGNCSYGDFEYKVVNGKTLYCET